MAHRAKHLPSQLSGGQQQRVAVARAVAGEPLILLADEPTGNLDSKSGESVMELLSALHQLGATICIVTHDPRYARHAERHIYLFDGQLADEPTVEAAGIAGASTRLRRRRTPRSRCFDDAGRRSRKGHLNGRRRSSP